ncbi:MAG: hypothetical protein BroJett030_19460 [Alphaproteobacteria bacterium]|nr:MAG: hypothetical protein BroJett030_19460 [Alphaproteobacteria bacterium]
MFIDASAIIAIIAGEPEGEAFAAAIEGADPGKRITTPVAAWEAAAALAREKNIPVAQAETDIREFLDRARIQIVAIAADDLSAALHAYDRYGRHRHPPESRNLALNLADCFHYACAKRWSVPILHKDAGLKLTDVATVEG